MGFNIKPFQKPSQACPTPVTPARQTVNSLIDYQVIPITSGINGALNDFLVVLQRPYNRIIFASTNSAGTVNAFFTFVATGQSAGNATGTQFLTLQAAPFVPLQINVGGALCFRKPIQQFFLSFIDGGNAPATHFLLVTNDINIRNTSPL